MLKTFDIMHGRAESRTQAARAADSNKPVVKTLVEDEATDGNMGELGTVVNASH